MVTHNIEEAVLMCDRILVFSSNPGRVVAEIKVDLPQPRNRLDPAFRQLVDDIYALHDRAAGRQAGAQGAFPGTGISMVLPRVSPNIMSGLMEPWRPPPYGGKADLPALADRCRWRSTTCSRSPRRCSCCASPRWPKATSG